MSRCTCLSCLPCQSFFIILSSLSSLVRFVSCLSSFVSCLPCLVFFFFNLVFCLSSLVPLVSLVSLVLSRYGLAGQCEAGCRIWAVTVRVCQPSVMTVFTNKNSVKSVNQMINLTNPDCGIHWELKTELKASNSSRRSGKSLLNNKIYSNIDCGDLLQAVYHGVVVVQRNISRVSVYIVWHSPV